MGLCLSYAIMDMPDITTLDEKYIFFYYGTWIETKPIAAGAATKNALGLFKYDQHTKLIYNDTQLINKSFSNEWLAQTFDFQIFKIINIFLLKVLS